MDIEVTANCDSHNQTVSIRVPSDIMDIDANKSWI